MNYQSEMRSQLADISPEKWEGLAGKRIFWGHQSVGRNILEGISSIQAEHKHISLKVAELKSNSPLSSGLWHSRVGRNTYPLTKIHEFEKTVNEYGSSLDIAGLKFCYVDVHQGTDVQALFDEYQSSITRLKNLYPHITFIHFTVPLEATSWDLTSKAKSIIKTIIGKPDPNFRRYEYNQLVRQAYEKKEPVFDLARIESTFPDGRRSIRTKNGIQYETLVSAYTNDGGHLNELGKKISAEYLLLFLLDIPN